MAEGSHDNLTALQRKMQSEQRKRMRALIREKGLLAHSDTPDILEMNGVPERPEEVLEVIFDDLFELISCRASIGDIVYVKRIRTPQARPIIAKMRSAELRNDILNTAVRFNRVNSSNKLNASQLGFTGLKIPILMSGYPSRLNTVHRQIVKSFMHRKIEIADPDSDDSIEEMPVPPPRGPVIVNIAEAIGNVVRMLPIRVNDNPALEEPNYPGSSDGDKTG